MNNLYSIQFIPSMITLKIINKEYTYWTVKMPTIHQTAPTSKILKLEGSDNPEKKMRCQLIPRLQSAHILATLACIFIKIISIFQANQKQSRLLHSFIDFVKLNIFCDREIQYGKIRETLLLEGNVRQALGMGVELL